MQQVKSRRWLLGRSCPAILAAFALTGCVEPSLHKSDRSLEELFDRSQADFSRLLAMTEQDKIQILWTKTREMEPSGSSLSDNRWSQYTNLCDAIGIRKIERTANRLLLISTTESQAFGHETVKGYAYSQVPLSPTVTSLDGGIPGEYVSGSKGLAYKPLKSGWYLFMQED